MKNDALIVAGVALALLAAGWYVKTKAEDAADAVTQVAQDAWDTVTHGAEVATDAVIAAPVIAIGEQIGIPKTNMNECQRAIAEGRMWDASFVCPIGTFLGAVADTVTK